MWADEAHYWVPAGTAGEDYDRDRRISFINDNRNVRMFLLHQFHNILD